MTLTNALDPLGKMGLGDRDLPCAGHCGASGSSSVRWDSCSESSQL